MVNSLAQAREKKAAASSEKPSENRNRGTFHIEDVTGQHVGESLIITGATKPPKKSVTPDQTEDAVRNVTENATDKPPEK